jgi:uncharacterized protein YodC (DUF2158 family)
MNRLCNRCDAARDSRTTYCPLCGCVEFRIDTASKERTRAMKIKRRKIAVFEIAELHIADEYQREVIAAHVAKIGGDEFVEEALGLPCVGVRSDGTKSVVDGMQRVTALRDMGYTHVECEWFESRGQEHEALVFLLKNNYKRLKSHELFKARLTAGDEETRLIYEAICESGLGVRGIPSKHRRSFQAVSSAKAAFKLGGGPLLTRALGLLKKAWGDQHDDAFKGDIMHGLAEMLHHVPEAQDDKLLRAMSKIVPSNMYAYVEANKRMRIASGGSRARAIAHAFHLLHDKALRGGRTTEWVDEPELVGAA